MLTNAFNDDVGDNVFFIQWSTFDDDDDDDDGDISLCNFFQAFNKVKSYLEYAKDSPNLKVLAGGTCDDK